MTFAAHMPILQQHKGVREHSLDILLSSQQSAAPRQQKDVWQQGRALCPVQRVYGVTFPDKKLMEEYKKRMEEAKKRDHRRLGTDQKLFFFNPVSPGSAFFLPRGMTICRRLIQVPCAHLSASTCQAYIAHASSTPAARTGSPCAARCAAVSARQC